MWKRRWPRAAKVYLVVALLCAASAASIVRSSTASVRATQAAVGPPVPVVVAATPVVRGTELTIAHLEVRQLPATLAPPGAVADPGSVAGRIVLTDLLPGEAVTMTRVAGEGAGPLAALVPPGLRAVAVAVPVLPPGLVAGDRVDVLATYGEGRTYTETVGRTLEILVAPDASGPGRQAFGAAGGVGLVLLADVATAARLARAAGFSIMSVAVVGSTSAPDG